MFTPTKLRFSMAATSLAALLATAPLAAGDFEKEIEYRQGIMNILSWNAKSIGGMLKGKTPFDAELIKTRATDIHRVAQLDIMAGFPEDSTSVDSSAMDEIWMDSDTFASKMSDFQSAAAALDKAAQSGDKASIGAAMKDLGASCKGCHKSFKN